MKPVRLPEIACPLPFAVYPDSPKFDAATAAWMIKWKLYSDDAHCERLTHTECGRLAALMYPAAKSDALLQVMADYTIWAFAFDDEYCDEGDMSRRPAESTLAMHRMQRAIECPEYTIDPHDNFALALRDLRQRMDALASPLHGARFVNVQRGYFFVEMNKLAHEAPREFNDCATLRLASGGGIVFPTLAHIASVNAIRQQDMESRRMMAMTEMAAMLIVWDSDIYSYGKELAREPDGRQHSLCAWIHHRRGLAQEDTVREAIALRNSVFSLYLRLREDMLSDAAPDVRDYIRGLDGYVRGGFHWIQNNDRYRFRNGVDGERAYEGGDLANALPPDDGTPIPVPALAWWWEHDPLRRGAGHRAHRLQETVPVGA
ncbi:hypothetical protein [Variovorax sp. EBFNA2]|uniref:terpene synthase family protein n=1 Tax=Variovorax sp. EBFNA2 TaxID=3342097 RepID=UPI0029C0FACC|nr:hypothetical protein [Variovorax boronicumulans]WPG37272.1 hypothetical protein RZE79_27950 [Variovorax boronicumulans]